MRLFTLGLLLAASLGSSFAQTPSAPPPRALPVSAADLTNAAPAAPQAPMAVANGVNVHWYGHGFIYLISSVGVRAAIDPFGADTVHYHFPEKLQADFVLISHEAEDHAAADMLYGNPLIFRSVTAVGLNRANGIPFRGVALQKDPNGDGASNTAFVLKFDGVTFCYLGQIAQPLIAQEQQQLGKVDVVFLPVGLQSLSVDDLNKTAVDLGAKIIVPINYKTDFSGIIPLRSVDEYLAATHLPVRRFDSSEIVVNRAMLPAQPTVYLLKSP